MAGNPQRRSARIFRSWWQRKVSLGISAGVMALALLLYLTTFVGERPTPIFDFLQRFELTSLDTRFRYRPPSYAHPDPRLIIVDIDQRSQEVLGRWPFSRGHFARLLDVLHEDGARAAAFDVIFSEPDKSAEPIRALRAELEARRKAGEAIDARLSAELARTEGQLDVDREFAQAIERFGPVVLGNFFLYGAADLRGLDSATLDRYANRIAYFPFPQVRPGSPSTGREDRQRLIQNYEPYGLLPRGALANVEVLGEALHSDYASTGFFNVPNDPDGVVRRALLDLPYGRSPNYDAWDLYASLDVQAVRAYLRLPSGKTVLDFDRNGIAGLEFGDSIRIRPDPLGRALINYRGAVRTFPYVSLADAVSRKFAPGTFRNKLVLIGASATGIGDLRSTPFGGLDFPGVEIHANVIDNILNQNFLARGANQVAVDLALILLFGIPLGVWLALAPPRWMWLALLLVVPFIAGVYVAFLKSWWLNFSVPALALVANVGLVALYRVLVEEKEKRKVRSAFQHYLNPEVIRRVLESPELVKPRKTEITVMFSDIREFTTISEQLDAQELAALLNQYLTRMTQIVFAQNGTLDKYVGDALMAFWGAPFEQPDHAARACRAALEMMRQTGELRRQWKPDGKPALHIGIGLHTGVASVGNMGSELRYGYTAIGDTVNLASRLEGLNKEYGTQIITSESTCAAASAGLVFRELDLIRVKGKQQPVRIYEPVCAREEAAAHAERLEMFAQGRACYQRRQWPQAEAIFARLIQRRPEDGPAHVFLQRSREFRRAEPPVDWDGVYVMTHK